MAYGIRRFNERKTFTKFLDRFVCTVPNPLDTRAQYDRYTHQDLQDTSAQELRHELQRLRLRILLDERAPAWLYEREAALRKALRNLRLEGPGNALR